MADSEEIYETLSCDEFLLLALDYEDTSLIQFADKIPELSKPLVKIYLSSDRVTS